MAYLGRHVYLVTYDLRVPGRNYQLLYDAFKQATTWWHYLESTWILVSPEELSVWQERIRNVIDANDSFLILELKTGTEHGGWLPQKAWDWLNQQLG